MTELKAVGFVSLYEDVAVGEGDEGRSGLQMTLQHEFGWFLSVEFLSKG
jgi:hypothetical protein